MAELVLVIFLLLKFHPVVTTCPFELEPVTNTPPGQLQKE